MRGKGYQESGGGRTGVKVTGVQGEGGGFWR